MTIINGKHYVDGGPEGSICISCRACPFNNLPNCGNNTCPRQPIPVESWDADQCWTYFSGYHKKAIEERIDGYYFVFKANEYSGKQEIELGPQPNLTAALRAAVIAVAEKESNGRAE